MSNTIVGGISGIPTAPTPASSPTSGVGSEGGTFGDTLRSALATVDQLHETSQSQAGELLHGDRQDLHNVMIAVEKADVAFQLMMQVRNKILNAYQDVSKLQF